MIHAVRRVIPVGAVRRSGVCAYNLYDKHCVFVGNVAVGHSSLHLANMANSSAANRSGSYSSLNQTDTCDILKAPVLSYLAIQSHP